MNREHLVRMANQIGTFFASMPDRAEAMEGIATHLKRFWEPRMLKEFRALLAEGGEGVHPLVREALDRHRALMEA
jgi:formate dehydrogenase subunit delta